MSPAQIRELKVKTFPYLVMTMLDCLCLTETLSEKNYISILIQFCLILTNILLVFCFYSMSECISTYYNPSVQNKSYVNLKPFYIKPYLTHESEIKFVEAEMEKLCQMGILRRGSSEFLSPIMLIKKSQSGTKLNKAPEYHSVVDFKYLNLHLPDLKFSYPEIKHVWKKIGRHSSRIYSVLDLKHVFHLINITEESKQYTSCASPGSPTYQYNKLSQGLNISPAYLTCYMNYHLKFMNT